MRGEMPRVFSRHPGESRDLFFIEFTESGKYAFLIKNGLFDKFYLWDLALIH